MPSIVFTPNVQRHVACPEAEAAGGTVREVLDNVFAGNPQARGYVLDDQSALRRHMTIFVDGHIIRDRAHLADPVHGPAASTCSRPCQEADPMSDKLLISTRKGLFTVARKPRGNGRSTGVDFLGDNVSLTLTDPRDGRHYAALDHGHFGVKLHRSTANGWEEIATPAYPPKPEGYEENDMWGRPINWSTARIWALAAGGADEPGRHLVRHATGRPVPLDRPRPELGDPARAVGPSQAQAMDGRWRRPARASIRFASIRAIPGACGSRSRPAASGSPRMPARAGRSAARACAPNTRRRSRPTTPSPRMCHCLAQCRAAPERMWVQHHNGIFVSSDEARPSPRSPASSRRRSALPVVVHPREPDTAWFVPEIKDEKRIPREGKLVVTRTRDGGKSFEVLSKGLPQSHAYDVVYRHALALDETGDRLAFGSTTGGLWVSEDQGDSWACVTHTLPPVYAVGFAHERGLARSGRIGARASSHEWCLQYCGRCSVHASPIHRPAQGTKNAPDRLLG